MTAISKLPGWTFTDLGSLGRWGSGGTPNRSTSAYYQGGDIPWLVIGDLNERVVIRAQSAITKLGLENSSAKLLPPGTLLVAMYGSIGKTAVTGVACATNQAIAYCVPHPGIDLRYLHRAVQWVKPALIAQGQGGAQQNISQGILKAQTVPLAPEREQKRIADKLDTILTRVDAVNTRLARVAPILKRFRQSVLSAATAGRLTEDWRTTRGSPQAEKTTLQSICQQHRVITYGVVKLGDETPGGTPCLRTSNVRWLRFELEGMKLIHPALSAEYKRTVLCGGEVLVNVRGTLGGVAVATSEMAGWNVSREVAVVPVDQKTADPAFIALWIASEDCQRWLTGVTKGVAYTGINIEDLRTLPLELPSKEEQAEIVRRVETLFAFADRLEARLQTAQTATERLTPALLAKAFRGELVPQDPNDEPASELLKRLATRVPAGPSKGRRAKASASAAC